MQIHDHNLIKSLAENGKTPIQISKELNIKYSSVTYILQKYSIYYRSNQGNIRYFQNIDSATKAYLLGFIAADGYIVRSNSSSVTLGIQINRVDTEVLELLRQEIGCEKVLTFPNNEMVRFTLSNPLLVNDLLNLGITQRKSKTLTNILLNIPNEFHGSFISGYLDGDGCIHVSNNPNITTIRVSIRGTEELLKGIADSLNLQNYSLFFNKTWILSFAKKEEVYKFYLIYNNSPFKLTRKINKFNQGIEKLILKYPKVQTISSS